MYIYIYICTYVCIYIYIYTHTYYAHIVGPPPPRSLARGPADGMLAGPASSLWLVLWSVSLPRHIYIYIYILSLYISSYVYIYIYIYSLWLVLWLRLATIVRMTIAATLTAMPILIVLRAITSVSTKSCRICLLSPLVKVLFIWDEVVQH